MAAPVTLRPRADALAAPLPPLLARAERLASTVAHGAHGRRRPGAGDEFWQFRHAMPGDPARSIDWRRSARSDATFVREMEWETSQAVTIWVDRSASMDFAEGGRAPKADRAALLGLACAILLIRGGERVALAPGEGRGPPPAAGRARLDRIAADLAGPGAGGDRGGDHGGDYEGDYGRAPQTPPPPNTRALWLSDFLGPVEPALAAMRRAADAGVRGVLCQVLDPAEEALPYEGRTVFESMGGRLRHETRKADALRGEYRGRLAERRAALRDACRRTGWVWTRHATDGSAAAALGGLYHALEGGGR
ncbi:uncharacterized protein DUF58 [Hasllibacter halocynthiae]|uniref:Uncharacterized protein DUF58 n=1 Tax=Hasllibacter halocynthiae TaxID=595589 RepID=A0A2T0X1B8_9RHOB|nr:DUF58 domain-containing protein [Hasllibacter halocynthiae]PRY92730.1 uncharacterized protein DUF58 [Hasllibacter halocynthiae]